MIIADTSRNLFVVTCMLAHRRDADGDRHPHDKQLISDLCRQLRILRSSLGGIPAMRQRCFERYLVLLICAGVNTGLRRCESACARIAKRGSHERKRVICDKCGPTPARTLPGCQISPGRWHPFQTGGHAAGRFADGRERCAAGRRKKRQFRSAVWSEPGSDRLFCVRNPPSRTQVSLVIDWRCF